MPSTRTPARPTPSDYDLRAIREIHMWRTPQEGVAADAMRKVNGFFNNVTDYVRKVPGIDWTIENVVTGLLELTNEIVQDSVWRDRIYEEFRTAGFEDVERPSDVARLRLEDIDPRAQHLNGKYRNLAAVEGAATGFAGAAGIIPDIIALVALNLRAVGEFATYYGFDIANEHERFYALSILDSLSQPSDKAKEVALAPFVRATRAIAQRQVVQAVEEFAVSRAIQNIARRIGVQLTKIKLTQVVPVTSAVVGSGFNAYYTIKVCEAAYFLYRERFLIQRYGHDAVQRTWS